MNSNIEDLVIRYLKANCPISRIRSDNGKRFRKSLIIPAHVVSKNKIIYPFELNNKYNLAMLGTIITIIDLVFGLTLEEQNVIAAKYLGF